MDKMTEKDIFNFELAAEAGLNIVTDVQMAELCRLARAGLAAQEGEKMWVVIAPSGFHEGFYFSEEAARHDWNHRLNVGWTVRPFRLVPVE